MAWVRKKGRLWQGRYRDANGKEQFAGSSTSKRTALALASDKEAEIRAGTWTDPNAGRLTFAGYFEDHWLPNRMVELNTLQGYRAAYNTELKEAFGSMQVKSIKRAHVQRWVNDMERRGVTPGNIRAKYRTLSTVLGARKGVSAIQDELIRDNPCERVALPVNDRRQPQAYAVPEADLLRDQVDEWWRPIPALAAESGLRWGELMGLHVEDFSDDFQTIWVNRVLLQLTVAETGNGTPYLEKARPKSGKSRKVALDPGMAAGIRAVVKARQLFPADRLLSMPDESGLPMRTPEWPAGLPVSRSFFRQSIWLPAHATTGVPARRFHDLRGSHISWILVGGADPVTVMQRVGHEQLSTTQLYVSAMEDADQRALDALRATRARYGG